MRSIAQISTEMLTISVSHEYYRFLRPDLRLFVERKSKITHHDPVIDTR